MVRLRAWTLAATSAGLVVAAACSSQGKVTNGVAGPEGGTSDASSSPPSPWPCPPAPAGADAARQQMASKQGTMGTAATAMVATSHATATQMGLDVLQRGGNAVDAFVAAVLTEDLVLPGVTSTAGLTGLLVYQASLKSVVYVQGPLRAPSIAPTGAAPGSNVMIPGEVAALALASQIYGRLPLSDVVSPVATLAAAGFPIDALYAASIRANAAMLQQSAYGAKTFFSGGAALAEGAILAQPEYGATLADIASGGADSFYRGAWADEFASAVAAAGGTASAADLADYQAFGVSPLMATHGAATLYTSAGYSSGGARLLLALATLENANVEQLGPFDRSPAALELLLRVHQAESTQETWLSDPSVLLDPTVASADIEAGAQTMWQAVKSGATFAEHAKLGSHSSAVIVVDADGNIAAGTHTIETTNWGMGLFAGGLPLSTAGDLFPSVAAGAYTVDPLSAEIAFVAGQPALVLSTYGTGLHPGDVQVLSNALDFGMSPEDAVLEPRLGEYVFIPPTTLDTSAHMLDARVGADIVCPVRAAGYGVLQTWPTPAAEGFIDTGFPTLVTIDANGGPARLKGMTPEWMEGVAAGY